MVLHARISPHNPQHAHHPLDAAACRATARRRAACTVACSPWLLLRRAVGECEVLREKKNVCACESSVVLRRAAGIRACVCVRV